MIFSRQEEKAREKESVQRLQKEVDKALTSALEKKSTQISGDSENIILLKSLSLAASKFEPVGRVVGNYNNLDTLKSIKIKNGDKVVVPNRPTSITVVGEVMSPGSVLWDSKLGIDNYVDSSAGFTQLADTSKIFVIEPNGQARRYAGLWGSSVQIDPGTTIVVPRKIEFTDTLGKISAVTSVIYQLTLALAGIDSLLLD